MCAYVFREGAWAMAHCKSLKRAERLSPKRECSQLCLALECMCVGGERMCIFVTPML